MASRGRPTELAQLLANLEGQTQRPAQTILSVTSPGDLPEDAAARATVVMGDAGLCAQRNRGMALLACDVDLIAFFDDDYLPRSDAIGRLADLYGSQPDVVAAHGFLIADGIGGPGISFAEAQALLDAAQQDPEAPLYLQPCEALYGCNMTFRRSALGAKRFDERLKLYGWQEDIDFSAQFADEGRIVSTNAFAGVHRGVKGARMSGRRFGYSQVVNPAYLVKKGTMRSRYALRIASRNVAANLLKALRPEPWIDRRGRFVGNLMGLWSLACGRAEPERVLDVS